MATQSKAIQSDKVESTNKGGAPLGNNNAAKGRQVTAMLSAALEANNRQLMREGVQKIANAFAEGEVWAVNTVFDRLEGKATQRIEGTGEDGEILTSLTVKLVSPHD